MVRHSIGHLATTTGKERSPQLLWKYAVLIVAVLASLTVLYITRWGIGTSPDSAGYIRSARALVEGGGAAQLGTQWPPLYPLLLAATSLFGMDALAGARWLNVLLFGANVALLCLLLLRTGAPIGVVLPGGALFVSAVPMLSVHAFAWSEATFLFLMIGSLAFVASHLTQPSPRRLLLGAVLAGLACLTRYAGLPLVGTGCFILLWQNELPPKQRLANGFLFTAVALTPPLLWLIELLMRGTSASREIGLHLVGRLHFWQVVYTMTNWLHLPAATPGFVRLFVCLLIALAAVALWWRLDRRVGLSLLGNPIVRAFALFVALYMAFLALTISFVDANTPLDDRILVPVYVSMLFITLTGVGEWLKTPSKFQLRVVVLGALLLFTGVQLFNAARLSQEQRQTGLGYSSLRWQQSETLEAVRHLPHNTVIFSNAPEAITLLVQRDVQLLPRRNLAMQGTANEAYEAEVAEVQRWLKRGAVVVYLDALSHRPVASLAALEDGVSLVPVSRTEDGAIYAAERQE